MNHPIESENSNVCAFSLDDRPYELDFASWIEKWWEAYLYSDRKRRKGPVFMIPGKLIDSQKDLNERSFAIDADKAILLSPINWISVSKSREAKFQEEIRKTAKMEIDIVNKESISVEIDNTIQTRDYCYRASTDIFELDGNLAISDGYWLFLKPGALSKGEHSIKSFGSCRSGKIQIPMNYYLTVK